MGKTAEAITPKKIKERVAYHESGHAVLAYLIGRTVLEIKIFPDKIHIYDGCMEDDSDDNPSSLEDAKKNICITYAGKIAENIRYGSLNAQAFKRMGDKDKKRAEKLLNKYFPKDKEKQKRLLRKKAKRLLIQKWPSVERLAEILIQGENGCSLKKDDVLRIIRN